MKNRTSLGAMFLLSFAVLFAACGGSESSPVVAGINLPPPGVASAANGNSSLWEQIDTLPREDLSDAELAALSYMREEEKLARDVYLYFFDLWGSQIFSNIATSEQTHTDAVLHLAQKYELADPAEGNPEGVFSDPLLQGLYDTLIAQGTPSLMDALIVGATIEDLDIFDLQRLLVNVDNQDIIVVFESLLKGSRNHMRAFSSRLEDLSVVYTPTYISQEEYDEIINSPKESGP